MVQIPMMQSKITLLYIITGMYNSADIFSKNRGI